MKTKLRFNNRDNAAFTLIELVVVVAVGVLVLAALFLPALTNCKPKASRINCANNLKQVGLAYRLWAEDNGRKFPTQVPVADGGTMELISAGFVAAHFTVLSNELGTPKILFCPADKDRTAATSYAGMANLNVSYFVGLNASKDTDSETWLAGDRNITNRNISSPLVSVRGVLILPTNNPVGWMDNMHQYAGNLCLADGSVQQPSSAKLNESLSHQTNGPLRLAMPE